MSIFRNRPTQSRIRRRDVEALLSGDHVRGEGFDRLAEAIAVVRSPVETPRSEIAAAALVGQAVAIARGERPPAVSPQKVSGATRRIVPRPAWSLAVGAMALSMMFGSVTVALAADRSAPGDLLYGLDRALEGIGFGAGGIAERVAEAGVLVDRGRAADAVAHLSGSLLEMSAGADRYTAALILSQLEAAEAQLGSQMAVEVAALKGVLLALLDGAEDDGTSGSGSEDPDGQGTETNNGQGNAHGPDGNSSDNGQGSGTNNGQGNAHGPDGNSSDNGQGSGTNNGQGNAHGPDGNSSDNGQGTKSNSGVNTQGKTKSD